MSVDRPQRIFMHGISGTGMRALAYLLAHQGNTIVGTDTVIDRVLAAVYTLQPEDQAGALLETADMYVYSDSVVEDHPLRELAKSKQITTLSYHAVLGKFAAAYKTVAVTGTHGKSSTTAFLAHILQKANVSPTALVGASVTSWEGENALYGTGDLFVVEADEYRNHFLTLEPQMIIIPTLEYDHPDYFQTPEDMYTSYNAFLDRLMPNGVVVTTPQVHNVPLHWPADVIVIDEEELPEAPLPGKHMQLNAALAIRSAEYLGVRRDVAQAALSSFTGLTRRMEIVAIKGSTVIISDYAHHPTEVTATISAVRAQYPDKELVVIFEAHMLERLIAFKEAFAEALSGADHVVLYPVFLPTGRRATEAASAVKHLAELQKLIRDKHVPCQRLATGDDLAPILPDLMEKQDIILAATAGTLDAALRTVVNTG